MLHFACARSHGRNALIQLIEDSGVSIAYRDELYRTARDVSMQATQPENTREIDKYVLSLAARGKAQIVSAFYSKILKYFSFFVQVNSLPSGIWSSRVTIILLMSMTMRRLRTLPFHGVTKKSENTSKAFHILRFEFSHFNHQSRNH